MTALALALVLCGAPKAPPVVEGDPRKGWSAGGEQVDAAEVLAVSVRGGWAAFKIVSHAVNMGSGAPEDQESIDCGYPGMKQHPTSGVRLMTWSLKAQAVDKVFVVYATASDQEHCSTPAQGKATLAAAKAEIAARGLDLAKKPPLSLDGVTTTDEEVRNEGEGLGDGVYVTTTVRAAGRPLYRLTYSYNTAMAGNAAFAALGAFLEDGKLVLFQRYGEGNMRAHEEWYGFSPVLTLPK